MPDVSYKDYSKHYDRLEISTRYNSRYRHAMRESDKRMLSLVAERAHDRATMRLLDFGCCNGNFLAQVRKRYPEWSLVGKDLAENVICECRRDPDLAGIGFEVADIIDPPPSQEVGQFDFVILLAVLHLFPPRLMKTALSNIHSYLKNGGWLLNFDLFHPFAEQEIVRVDIESREYRPDCPVVTHYYPSQLKAEEWCRAAGFTHVEFESFFMPFDLTRRTGSPASTHTELLVDGRRLSMLGVIAQPWVFLRARK